MFFLQNQVKRFVVIFPGRTGSTYLIQALNSHPDVRAVGELLGELAKEGPAAQLAWTQQVLTPPVIGRHRAIGFKTKLRVILDQAGFAETLREANTRVIFLQRANQVKLVVSWINSERLHQSTGEYNLYRETDRLPPPVIDFEDFDQKLALVAKEREELAAYARFLKLPSLFLDYEDLLRTPETTFRRVFDYLDVPYRPVLAKTTKNTSDDLSQAISNFDELRSHYTGTPYLAMFDEGIARPGLEDYRNKERQGSGESRVPAARG